ncbi:MAG: MoxR family ATPase [Magnetococcales bacterium]|nr:MoxR family ATPase [Magnetococcales bacterium]
MSNQHVISTLLQSVTRKVLGQDLLINRLVIALLADGHLLVEGAPGLAKTRAVKILAAHIDGAFHRVQFTPDLLPADLTGTETYRPGDGTFQFQPGPLFHNLILADEINRAPAKVQSALLEAMGERQITVGPKTYPLPPLFMVMATQNPIEQEGTHPLPEAQLDRFLLLVRIGYPVAEVEREILRLVRDEARQCDGGDRPEPVRKISPEQLLAARQEVLAMHMADPVENYLLHLILATRSPQKYGAELAGLIQYGASPRATIALDRCARAHAWLAGRDFVTPDDVRALAPDVLRHRLVLTFEAEAKGHSADGFISQLLQRVPAP